MRMRKACKDFLYSNLGTVALSAGLSAIPMMLVVGVALDYMRANRSEAILQAAVDAAALAGGASPRTDDAMVKRLVSDYLVQNGAGDITGSIDKIKIERPDGKTFKVTSEGSIPTTLMKIAGIDEMTIGAMSEVTQSYGRLEVALVLDNTGSMKGSKIQALKESAHVMVDELFSDPRNPDVKVALVPFSWYVNVGIGRRHLPWVSVPDDDSATGQQWHGCVGSRDHPLDVEDNRPATPYLGIMNASCPSEIMPLTTDKGRIGDEINNMIATGYTYIPAGLIWGWNAVSSVEPLSEGAAESEPEVSKAIVLMTDGDNTLYPTYPKHEKNNGNDRLANELSLKLCANIKAAGIKLFTVSFEVTNPVTEAMLRDCASGTGDYFNANNPAQLKTAFKTIAGTLANLRIAR